MLQRSCKETRRFQRALKSKRARAAALDNFGCMPVVQDYKNAPKSCTFLWIDEEYTNERPGWTLTSKRADGQNAGDEKEWNGWKGVSFG